MDSQEKLDEARACADVAARTKDTAELRWRELEHAKAQATASPEGFDHACDELARGQRALELAQLAAERANEDVAAAESAHALEVLGRVSKAYDLSLAHLKGPKVNGLTAAFKALHEAVAEVEESIRQTAALSYELGRLAETAGNTSVQTVSPSAVRAQALGVYPKPARCVRTCA